MAFLLVFPFALKRCGKGGAREQQVPEAPAQKESSIPTEGAHELHNVSIDREIEKTALLGRELLLCGSNSVVSWSFLLTLISFTRRSFSGTSLGLLSPPRARQHGH
ncbi:hypothetical protein RRG08_031356 [Elysia crispata]|uniref:Uncharacterized protein n=1 Tax=Elysia crispata TaxID=231223 RepID=A0AAE0YIH5_9GAST|nr:hypothetical protein RRG08_031356 [Elysia crispata]